MIDTQAIRSKILDLAMRGKLTEQLPEDGTAEELYRQIQEGKQALIKAGKIKKEKPLPEISVDNEPFIIPSNWKWVRVGAIAEVAGGTTPKSTELLKKGGIPYFKVSDMNAVGNETHMVHAVNFISTNYKGKIFPAGTTIFPKNGGAALTNKRRILMVPSALDLNSGGCSPFITDLTEWIRLFMDTIDFGKMNTGSNIPTVNATNLKKQYLPLPPLAEQHRIVARIEQAFAALDTIDALQAKYADNLAVLKSKLIDAAIRGKLTDQLPEDGTAEELYRQIQAEKQALIKAGKIKKEKPPPEITADEIPFDIPKSWKWVRTGDVFSVGTGLTPLTNEKRFYENGRIPWVTSSLTSNRYIQDATTYLSEYALEATSLRLHPEHTLIIAMYGEGKTRGQIAELLIPATTNQACATLDNIVYNQATVDYVYFFFTHNYVQLRSQAGGSNQPNLNLNKIKETPIPLPPLAEQKRIVDRINELLAVCDELKSKGNP